MTKATVHPSDSPSPKPSKQTEIELKGYIKEQMELLEKNEFYLIYKKSEAPEQLAKMKLKQEKHFREKFDFKFPETKESVPISQTKSNKHYSANNRKVAVTGDEINKTLANAKRQTKEEVMDLVMILVLRRPS